MTTNSLQERYKAIDAKLRVFSDKYDTLETELERLQEELTMLNNELVLVSAAIGESLDARLYLEQVVNLWIQPMYDTAKDKYEFKFDVVQKKDGTISGYRPTVYKNGKPERQGEAMSNIISTILRAVFLECSNTAPFVVFDEPLGNVSTKKYGIFFDNFLEFLKKTNIKAVLVTHQLPIEFPQEIIL